MKLERLLGLDIGGKRIGVAISDEMGSIASPLVTVNAQGDVAAELRKLAEQYGIERIVVGLPVGLSGREGPQAQEVRRVADALGAALGREVIYYDERLSSAIAEQSLIQQKTRREKRKEHIDAMAAAVILQGYLDAQRWKIGK
ncbi:MAG: Holliday junction resolvase RuvX [Thermomicrobiales bacterium]|nr:Holliday junction resolvase RuvX [Thermomicrobiales bacterium]